MTEEVEVAEERHAVRTLVKFVVLAALVFLAGRFLAQKKNEYAGLTEREAKDKLVETIGPRLGDETAEEIADSVIPKLKDRGLLKADPVDQVKDAAGDAVDKVKDVSKDAADSVSDTAKKATDKAKDAAKDMGDKVSDAVDEVTKN